MQLVKIAGKSELTQSIELKSEIACKHEIKTLNMDPICIIPLVFLSTHKYGGTLLASKLYMDGMCSCPLTSTYVGCALLAM